MEIIFKNGVTKPIDINVSASVIFKLRKENVINGDFLRCFVCNSELTDTTVLQAVYATYRQANTKNYLKFKEFQENIKYDHDLYLPIYLAVVSKENKKLLKKVGEE